MDAQKARDVALALGGIAKAAAEAERTLLAGWPGGWTKPPTTTEARHIVVIHGVLVDTEPGMDDTERWRLAGRLVHECAVNDLTETF